MKRVIPIALIILCPLLTFAQGKYSTNKLLQLSHLEFNEYDWEAQKLKNNGEKLSIYGGLAGLAGLGLGSLTGDQPLSSSGSDGLNTAAAVLLYGGTAATLIGIPMFFLGLTRSTRIDEVRPLRPDFVRLQLSPHQHYCPHSHTHYAGISLCLTF